MSITLDPTGAPIRPPDFRPTAEGERIHSIDFARGIALLGILLVNAQVMFSPLAAMAEPGYLSRRSSADRIASLLVLSLCTSKFVSQFSMLFGYGLFGQIEKAAAAGRSPAWFTIRRLGALALFGLVHGLFIWFGDILFIYACLGAWLLLARGASARTLLLLAGGLLVFALLLRAGLELAGALTTATAPPIVVPQAESLPLPVQTMLEAGFYPAAPVWIEAETAAYGGGPWRDAQVFRTVGLLFNWIVCVLLLGWLALGMFFLGAALNRIHYFSPEQAPLRRRVLSICLPTGLAIEAVASYFFWTHPPTEKWAWAIGSILQQAGLFCLPLGYLTLSAVVADWLPPAVRGPVCSAGRMSLTVYLLESVIATGLSYHWGLGWFGQVGPLYQVLLAICLWLVLVAFSHAWLMRFRQGPMEWLWRRLGYGKGPSPRPAAAIE